MSNMFGGGGTQVVQAPAPTPAPPPLMPDPFAPEAMAARQKALGQIGRAGRTSTVLTTPGGALGGAFARAVGAGGNTAPLAAGGVYSGTKAGG